MPWHLLQLQFNLNYTLQNNWINTYTGEITPEGFVSCKWHQYCKGKTLQRFWTLRSFLQEKLLQNENNQDFHKFPEYADVISGL